MEVLTFLLCYKVSQSAPLAEHLLYVSPVILARIKSLNVSFHNVRTMLC